MLSWLLFPVLGAITGLLAGMLGVGGGLVVVPGLLQVFAAMGVDSDHRMRLALGTSLAAICFTGFASQRAHHRLGFVDWGIVRAVVPGIVVGTFAGSWVATLVPGGYLEGFFAIFLAVVCVRMLRDSTPAVQGRPPGSGTMVAAGAGIGLVSGVVGIGGGSLSVPFLSHVGLPIHRAVGTSAAIGVPIAIVGAAGYVLNGFGRDGLPAYSLGYVYLPALVGVAVVSVPMAPLGARFAHRLPVRRLKRAFALFLLIVAARMALAQLLALYG